MNPHLSRRTILAGAATLGALSRPLTAAAESEAVSPAMQALLDYVQGQKTTGFMVVQDRKVLVEKNWPAPSGPTFKLFAYERSPDGALLEDVASQQKSWVSILIEIAIDKGLIDVNRPVADYIGPGWSKASTEQEAKIRVINVLNMNSGLTEDFAYEAPPGTQFFYNTPVYAITKKLLAAAAKQPLETITHDWLTGPAGLSHTDWRKRPSAGAFAAAANPTGLVTDPRDSVIFGQILLDGGKAANGVRIVSEAGLNAMFARSPTNPAYGRLWWLNGGQYAMRIGAGRVEGPLIPTAPADLVAALGALDRKLYVVPSRKLVVVRMGAATEKGFDQQLWLRLMKAIA